MIKRFKAWLDREVIIPINTIISAMIEEERAKKTDFEQKKDKLDEN